MNRAAGALPAWSPFAPPSGWSAGEYGFVDRLVLAHEEVTQSEGHPHGGTIFALDVAGEVLWALPALGRGSWENSAAVSTPDGDRPDGHVALLLGDDLEFGRAPLYLWIGRKIPGGNFIERNGLAAASCTCGSPTAVTAPRSSGLAPERRDAGASCPCRPEPPTASPRP